MGNQRGGSAFIARNVDKKKKPPPPPFGGLRTARFLEDRGDFYAFCCCWPCRSGRFQELSNPPNGPALEEWLELAGCWAAILTKPRLLHPQSKRRIHEEIDNPDQRISQDVASFTGTRLEA